MYLFDLIGHYFLPFVLVISIVVFVHEFGHYWVARRNGVKVDVFSIGFGPELFGRTDKHGTRWRVALVPLGGYVKMFGDADPASQPDKEKIQTMTAAEKQVAFFHKTVGQRAAIVAAGPAVNYIFAVIVLAILFMTGGQPYTAPVVGKLVEGKAAARAGLQLGDRIVKIDDTGINRFEEIVRIISLNTGTEVKMTIKRGDSEHVIAVTPELTTLEDRFGNTQKRGAIGIASEELEVRVLSPVAAIKESVHETWTITALTLKAIGQMIMGTRSTDDLGGVLRIAKMSGDIAGQKSIAALFWFMAMISINLGLINLFPVPLLDGGHLAFYAAEAARGKPLPDIVHKIGANIGMVMVLALMLFATWNDLVHLKVIAYLKTLIS